MKRKEKVVISIIIVRYRVIKELFDCLDSLKRLKDKTSYEVILVDNDIQRPVEKEIHKDYKWVTYVKAPRNLGFGPGNNLGATYAKGKYLFFLNSDTVLFPGALDALTHFFELHKDAGVISPLLLDSDKKPYEFQGTQILTPFRALFAISFIGKLFPKNPVARKYFMTGWNKTKVKEVDVIPGTAVMMKRELFDAIDGWDNNIFIYFEEYDLCKRVKEKGYNIYIVPKAKIIHLWERSTKSENDFFMKIFRQSRFYYFKKHYGILNALFVNAILNFGKASLFMLGILIIAVFLLFYRVSDLIPFIGDQGWFYLAARDVVLEKSLPLVGITASHPWLHQGAYWTYMLAFMLWLFHFNPVSGSYLTAFLGLLSVLLIYFVGKMYFSKGVGIIAAFLYATSPLVIMNARMAYHTSPIPFFTLLFMISLYQWTQGKKYSFPLCIFFLAVLYNFELATATLGIVFIFIVLFGIWKKKGWIKMLRDWRVLSASAFAYIIPMLPMIFYDIHHGFPQTLKFVAWLGYHVLLIFGFPSIHPDLKPMSWSSVVAFAVQNYQKLIFAENAIVAFAIFIVTFVLFYTRFYHMIRHKTHHLGTILIGILTVLLICGFFANRTTSSAYLPDIFPFLILLTAVATEIVMKKFFASTFLLLLIICVLNAHSLLIHNYFVGITYKDRLLAAEQIVINANHNRYNIVDEGQGSEFASFTMNYQYLTWWLGSPASSSPQSLQFVILEKSPAIYFKQEKRNK